MYIFFKDNDLDEVRYFSNDSFEKAREEVKHKMAQFDAKYAEMSETVKKGSEEIFKRKIQMEPSKSPFEEEVERKMKQYDAEYNEMVRRKLEADLKRKRRIEWSKKPLKEKLAGFSKDLINSAKDASIKAGRNAKAGLLHGMRKVSDSLRH